MRNFKWNFMIHLKYENIIKHYFKTAVFFIQPGKLVLCSLLPSISTKYMGWYWGQEVSGLVFSLLSILGIVFRKNVIKFITVIILIMLRANKKEKKG